MPIAAIKSSLPRRLFVVTAVGALAAVALLVGPTRPGNAAGCTANGSWATCYSDVTAIAGSSMTIFDDEWLETDEIGNGFLDLTGMGIAFTPYVSSGTRVISKCAGGEVRVEFTLNAERSNADGTVRVGGIANLFEGTEAALRRIRTAGGASGTSRSSRVKSSPSRCASTTSTRVAIGWKISLKLKNSLPI